MHVRKKNGETGKRTFRFFPYNTYICPKRTEKEIGVHDSPGRIFAHRLNTSRRGATRVARWMDGLVGRATEGSSGRLSRTPRATPALIPGKVGEGIANPFPKGALLAPRASGKPLPIPAGMAPVPCAHRRVKADSKGFSNPLVALTDAKPPVLYGTRGSSVSSGPASRGSGKGGNSRMSLMPKCSKNLSVVPYSMGRPSASLRPTSLISPLLRSDCTE